MILGGKDKGLDYTALREPLAAKARAALLIGAAAAKIADQLEGAVPLVDAQDARRARSRTRTRARIAGRHRAARARLRQLRPVPSYEHRGEVFKQIVERNSEPKE